MVLFPQPDGIDVAPGVPRITVALTSEQATTDLLARLTMQFGVTASIVVGWLNGSGRKRFGCPSHEVKGECLDEVVWSHIVEQLSSPELIQDRLSKMTSEDPTRYDRETIGRQLVEVNKKLSNIRRSIASIEDEDFQAQLIKDANDFSKRKNTLLEEQELLNARLEQWTSSQHEIVSVGASVLKMKRTLTASLTTEQK